MAQIFDYLCIFNGGPVSNATNGWDAVYAVKYDTINADLFIRQPWIAAGINGMSYYDATWQTEDFTVLSLMIVPGDYDPDLEWELIATVHYQDGIHDAPVKFKAQLVTSLSFEESSSPGLHNLNVQHKSLSVKNITVLANDADDVKVNILKMLQVRLIDYAPAMLTASLASIMTDDYAESVNVPWLRPKHFRYVLGRMPDNNNKGLLTILSSSQDNWQDLTVDFDSHAFPINNDLSAAMIISSRILGNKAFVELLNNAIGNSVIGNLKANEDDASLANGSKISLRFLIDKNTGAGKLMTREGAKNEGGISYDAWIPAEKLIFRVQSNLIQIELASLIVDYGAGASMEVSMISSFTLIVNTTTNSIDIALAGEPKVTTSFKAGAPSLAEQAVSLGGMIASTIFSELLAYGIDQVGSLLTAASPAKMRQYHLDFQAAVAQSDANEGKPVKFFIGRGKEMVVSLNEVHSLSEGEMASAAEPLKTTFKSRLKFETALKLGIEDSPNMAVPEPENNPTVNHNIANNNDTQGALLDGTLPAVPRGRGQPLNFDPIQVEDIERNDNQNANALDTYQRRIFQNVPHETMVELVRQLPGFNRSLRRTNIQIEDLTAFNEIRGQRVNAPVDPRNIINDEVYRPAQAREGLPGLDMQPIDLDDELRPAMTTEASNRELVNAFCKDVLEIFAEVNRTRTINEDDAVPLQAPGWLEQIFGQDNIAIRDGLIERLANNPEELKNFSAQECQTLYTACATFMNEGYSNGYIDATEYINMVRQYNTLAQAEGEGSVLIGGWRTPDRDGDATQPEEILKPVIKGSENKKLRVITKSTNKSPKIVMNGYLDDLMSTMEDDRHQAFGSATATAALVREAILDAKKPFWPTAIGYALYVLGLAGGYFGGNYLADGIKKVAMDDPDGTRENAASHSAETVLAVNKNAADMLFSHVSFPLMTTYIANQGATTIPLPANVLKRAAVNGGLVLGVAIGFNLPSEP